MDGNDRILNQREIRITGLARSGNHAVINWLISQIQGEYCFLNCAEPKTNPFLTARPLSEDGSAFQTNISGFSIEEEQQGNVQKKDFLLYSYEDVFLSMLDKKIFRENRHDWLGASICSENLLILRDPFNLFASRKKSGFLDGQDEIHGLRPITNLTLKRIYKQHAREFLGRSKLLKNLVRVNFNKWASEKNFRREIAERLDISFTDSGFSEVKPVAGGSSFDGTRYSGRAEKMQINDRWRTFSEDEEYWALFDPELADLCREIFGPTPAWEYYTKNFT